VLSLLNATNHSSNRKGFGQGNSCQGMPGNASGEKSGVFRAEKDSCVILSLPRSADFLYAEHSFY
jgi:hypothetical protein